MPRNPSRPDRTPRPSQHAARFPLSAAVFFAVMIPLGMYFAFAAVQGPKGLLRRVQIQAETADLQADRAALQAETDRMRNLTRRLSDDYLDIDLLDERAREVLGLVRSDEAVIR